MKDQYLVIVRLQKLSRRIDARRRHAEHGGGNRRLVVCCGCWLRLSFYHANHRMGGVAQYSARDSIKTANVYYRVHHQNVADADVGPHLPAGEGADH